MSETTSDPRAALGRLRRATAILVTSHASPDGDAVGSSLAMAELAEAMGLEAHVVSRDPVPETLRFLPHHERLETVSAIGDGLLAFCDLAVILECPGLDRPGIDGLDRLPILNIDHHLGNEAYGEVNFVDENAPAVGEMVLAMAEAAAVPVSPQMATNLYTALVTDTGDFRYSNASPRAFRAAARLVEAGAAPHRIAGALSDHVPARVVRLTAEVHSTLEILASGRLAVITCDAAMLERTGARPEDTENLISLPRRIEGVEVAVLLKAFWPEMTRVSMRSREHFDVQAVAQRFGGGGHRAAAGCTIEAPLAAARAALLDVLIPQLES
jgi:bifunctional oligoribonuclease and PAP phosphatase NrnA